jgi:putative two-component system response regulator
VLVVDDTPENLHLMHGLLKERYRVLLANGGVAALRLARLKPRPDLILLNWMAVATRTASRGKRSRCRPG